MMATADIGFAPHITGQLSPNHIVDGVENIRQFTREVVRNHVDFVKMMVTAGVMSPGDEPGGQRYTEQEVRAAAEIADLHGLPFSCHAHGARGIKTAVRAGATSIEHCTMADEEGIHMMAERGTYLVPTIVATVGIAEQPKGSLPANIFKKLDICMAHHKGAVQLAVKEGVKFAFGTDAATPGNTHGTQTREFGLMVDYGLSTMDALLSATVNGADLNRVSKDLGSITPGKYADVVAYSEDPFDDISTMNRVNFVMKGGEVYKRDGEALYPITL